MLLLQVFVVSETSNDRNEGDGGRGELLLPVQLLETATPVLLDPQVSGKAKVDGESGVGAQ